MESKSIPIEASKLGFSKSLKGLTACVADRLIIGKVYVLLDFSKVDDFTPGSILVTEQTSPECTTAMENAIAIVTERG